jgi:flavin-binding protein dodecin
MTLGIRDGAIQQYRVALKAAFVIDDDDDDD